MKSKRGFESMDADKQKAIARKGGLTLSQNREYMRTIGRIGGTVTQEKLREKNKSKFSI